MNIFLSDIFVSKYYLIEIFLFLFEFYFLIFMKLNRTLGAFDYTLGRK